MGEFNFLNLKPEKTIHVIGEGSYKYLESFLKPFMNTLEKNIPEFSDILTNEELFKVVMKKYYEYSKIVLDNLLPQQDKFYNLLIEAGRAKELLDNNIERVKLKTVIDFANPEVFGQSLDLIVKEYVDFIIDNLKNRVRWLVSEYNDLNFDKQYEIKDIEGNLIL